MIIPSISKGNRLLKSSSAVLLSAIAARANEPASLQAMKRIKRLEMLVFPKTLRTYLMDDPYANVLK